MTFYFDLNMIEPTKRSQLFDVESIYQGLTVLLNTRPGDFPFRPRFGVNLDESLFEFADTLTALDIYRIVSDAIIEYEPRVELDNSRSNVVADPDNNTFNLELYFQIPDLSEDTFEFTGTLGLGENV